MFSFICPPAVLGPPSWWGNFQAPPPAAQPEWRRWSRRWQHWSCSHPRLHLKWQTLSRFPGKNKRHIVTDSQGTHWRHWQISVHSEHIVFVLCITPLLSLNTFAWSCTRTLSTIHGPNNTFTLYLNFSHQLFFVMKNNCDFHLYLPGYYLLCPQLRQHAAPPVVLRASKRGWRHNTDGTAPLCVWYPSSSAQGGPPRTCRIRQNNRKEKRFSWDVK